MERSFFSQTRLVSSGGLFSAFYLTDERLEFLVEVFKYIFSWAVLMPIAVIISGKLLALPFKVPVETDQRFVVPIPKILHLQANNGEVILGFAGFIITLVFIALAGGKPAYELFKSHFGIDPGHFNSLCILSSFLTVIWSVSLWLGNLVLSKRRKDPAAAERDELILKLAEKLNSEDGK
jgi:hypothetical protein